MAENRYTDKEIHRRKRHKMHKIDEEMRRNEEIAAQERRARKEQKRREELQRRLVLVIPE